MPLYDDADASGLFGEIWNEIRVRPYELLENGIDGSEYSLSDEHFLDFLYLLKMLPSSRYTFEKSVSNFIKISQVKLPSIFLNQIDDTNTMCNELFCIKIYQSFK